MTMQILLLPFRLRYIVLTTSVTAALLFLVLAQHSTFYAIAFALATALSILGLHDLMQTKHSVWREPVASLLRKDNTPSPEPRRRSRRKQRAMDDFNGPNAKRPPHACLRCPSYRRRSLAQGNSAMPQTLHCSRTVSVDPS
jgi:hypothetical protein